MEVAEAIEVAQRALGISDLTLARRAGVTVRVIRALKESTRPRSRSTVPGSGAQGARWCPNIQTQAALTKIVAYLEANV